MLKYIVKRILLSIPIFIGITFIVFMLSNMAPGGPLDIITFNSSGMSDEQVERMKEEMNLDKPLPVQYGIWLKDFFSGDAGDSYRTNTPVMELIGERIGPTIQLACAAFLFSILVSMPLGIMAAYKPYSIWDNLSRGLAFFATSTPNFFISLILIYILSVKWRLLPNQGVGEGGLDTVRHMIMPVLVLSVQIIGTMIRYTRNSMMEVLKAEHMTAARAKGIREWQVVIRHGLRNALMPIITVIGNSIPILIGGSVVIEQIFSWPGIGSLMVTSISVRDYPTIMGITVLVAVTVLVTNLLVDLIYGVIDPRVSH